MVMKILELITKTLLQSLSLQENFKNKTNEEKGNIFLQRQREKNSYKRVILESHTGVCDQLHDMKHPTHWQKVKLTQNQTKFNCVYSNSQTLGFVLFFISLRKSKNCITGLGLSQGEQKKVNSWHTLDWKQSTLDPTRLSQNWKPVSTQYTSTAKHTGEKLNTTLIVCRHRRFQSFGLLLFSTITHISYQIED